MASGINKAVRILKTILVLLLALAWVPLSLHCQIEAMPGWEFLACESEEEEHSTPHQSSDCEDDFCQIIESGLYKTEERAPLLCSVNFLPPGVESSIAISMQPPDPGLSPSAIPSPPLLANTWQFTLRTALLPRAPSLAS